MSILIRGMEMPKSCWRCQLCLTVDPDTYRCIPTGQEFESTFDAIDHIVLSCPLVEVPPHGRLIDADALEELFREVIGNIFKREEIKPVLEHMVRASAMAVEMIKDAPTIIEAEVDDG